MGRDKLDGEVKIKIMIEEIWARDGMEGEVNGEEERSGQDGVDRQCCMGARKAELGRAEVRKAGLTEIKEAEQGGAGWPY